MAMKNELFKKHYTRLCLEAGLRSALFGLAIGFVVAFVLSALEWLLDFGASWLSLAVFVFISAVIGVLLYFFKYRPTMKDVAKRLDRLGLDERMITMLEYEGDDSYIATLQRENAQVSFKTVENKKLKLRISIALIAIAVSAAILGSSMTTVLALAENGILPSGSTIIAGGDEFWDYIPVSYIVDEGGYITGAEADQLVAPGEDAEPVVAEAEDGWVFVGWDDGSTDPARHDKNITEPREYIAIFEQIEDEEDSESSDGSEGEEGEEGDQSQDQPSDDSSSESEGGQQEENQETQDGQPSDSENDSESENSSDSESNSGSNGQGAGGKWEETNMFYDGQTYYKDAMDYYYDQAQQYFDENGDLPEEFREFFELYFGSL